MGYRSDVVQAMQFRDRPHLVGFLTKLKLTGDKFTLDAMNEYEVTELDTGVVILHGFFEDVKWYETFEDVQAHIRMLSDAYEHGAHTLYLRIGESTDDIAEEEMIAEREAASEFPYAIYDCFRIVRHIEPMTDGVSISKYIEENDDESK